MASTAALNSFIRAKYSAHSELTNLELVTDWSKAMYASGNTTRKNTAKGGMGKERSLKYTDRYILRSFWLAACALHPIHIMNIMLVFLWVPDHLTYILESSLACLELREKCRSIGVKHSKQLVLRPDIFLIKLKLTTFYILVCEGVYIDTCCFNRIFSSNSQVVFS